MAKIDKSQYTKEEWKRIRNERRMQKSLERNKNKAVKEVQRGSKVAFVIGNGTSRKPVNLESLVPHGKLYGCNALYRTFKPDYLIAVDVKMILEINKSGFQHYNEVWTNPNRNFSKIKNLNYFSPSKGWSSGPTALWLASEHKYETIFILGFDYRGLDDGKLLNNIYADTMNYKKSTDQATFFGNWMRQTKNVIQTHPDINFVRVIAPDNYKPEELNTFDNYSEMLIDDFIKLFENS